MWMSESGRGLPSPFASIKELKYPSKVIALISRVPDLKLPLKVGRSSLPSGDQSAVEPPGPIPNPEVKRRSADGSGTIGPVRVGRRQVYARLL